MLCISVVLGNRTWLCCINIRKLTLPFFDFNAYLGHLYKVFQYSVLLRVIGLLFRSFPNSSQITWMWIHIDLWQIRNNIGAFLHKLHENEILWQKFIVLHGSIWIVSNIAMLHNAIHIKVRDERKNKGIIKLERLLT